MSILILSRPSSTLFYSKVPLVNSQLVSGIKSISSTELIQLPNFARNNLVWSNDILLSEGIVPSSEDFALIEALLLKTIPLDSFVICDMGKAGHGVFSQQLIRKSHVLFYSGKYSKEVDVLNFVYALTTNKVDCVDAEYVGGISSIILDLFPQQIASIPLIKKTLSILDVAQNNFTLKLLKLSFGTIPYLEASKDIRPYTQCGFSYGKSYWGGMKDIWGVEKLFFNNQGKVIVGKDAEILNELAEIQPRKNSIQKAGQKLNSN